MKLVYNSNVFISQLKIENITDVFETFCIVLNYIPILPSQSYLLCWTGDYHPHAFLSLYYIDNDLLSNI